MRKINPKNTALMRQREKDYFEKRKKVSFQHYWVPLSQINENLKRAVIVAEDGDFYQHEEIGWYKVKQSIRKDIQKGKFVRGASTITERVAKNLFLSTLKNPIRKLKEILIAWMLEDELTKSRIHEIYLIIIELGQGIFGVGAALQNYFGKNASELTHEDAACLASVIANPLRHNPNKNTQYLHYRKKVILERVEVRGC